MSYRIFMTINRGITDETPVCVYPWERPLLEEIHGAGAQPVSIEEMCSMKGVKSVAEIKLPSGGERETPNGEQAKVERAPGLREQLVAMTRVAPENDPANDVDTEWGRLLERYGMHPKVEMPVVEKVYGSLPAFRKVVRAYRGSTPPRVDPIEGMEDAGAAPDVSDELAPADMSVPQLKAALGARDIEYKKSAKREELEELLTNAITETA